MKRLVYLAMLCTAVLAPRTALSQDDAPERRTSISLRPFEGQTIGLWHRFSPRLELGVEAGATISETEGEGVDAREQRAFATVETTAKVYGRPGGELRPYGAGGLFFSSQGYDYGGGQESSAASVGVSLGAGAEWSPVPRVRIGGHVGVRAAALMGERTTFDENGPIPYDMDGIGRSARSAPG